MKNPFKKEMTVNPATPVAEKRPQPISQLGISTYNPKPTENDLLILLSRFSQNPRCECCGASLSKEMNHALHDKDAGWVNACGMCYYPSNLDLIPYFERGEILYFPAMDQARFNTLLRAVWSVDTFSKAGTSQKVFQEFKHAMTELVDKVNGQLNGMAYYFESTSVDILVATLDLLKPDEYEQRHKLLKNFLWYPKKEIFKNEITYWAQSDFNLLHPAKIDDNIAEFMANYKPVK